MIVWAPCTWLPQRSKKEALTALNRQRMQLKAAGCRLVAPAYDPHTWGLACPSHAATTHSRVVLLGLWSSTLHRAPTLIAPTLPQREALRSAVVAGSMAQRCWTRTHKQRPRRGVHAEDLTAAFLLWSV